MHSGDGTPSGMQCTAVRQQHLSKPANAKVVCPHAIKRHTSTSKTVCQELLSISEQMEIMSILNVPCLQKPNSKISSDDVLLIFLICGNSCDTTSLNLATVIASLFHSCEHYTSETRSIAHIHFKLHLTGFTESCDAVTV